MRIPEPEGTATFLCLRPTQMAKAMGVSYSTYKKWASGANPLPPVARRLLIFMYANPDLARSFDEG